MNEIMRIKLGNITLQNNLVAAPMAGFTDMCWRQIAIECFAGIVFSEMISVEGLLRRQLGTIEYLKNFDTARPFGIQLFGAEPESFVRSLPVLEGYNFDLFDINMGCPVKKVVSKGAGCALMREPKKVESILKAVRKNYNGALTVKIRSGWNLKNINAVEIARIAEGSGIDAVIVHPRTKEQGFSGRADLNVIKEVKHSVKIPVIGNGDVKESADIERMFNETSCDCVMIGRAALGKPWIFANPPIPPLEKGGKTDIPPFGKGGRGGFEVVFSVMRRHFALLRQHEDERYAMNMVKKFLPKYLKGLRGAKDIIRKVNSAKKIDEMLNCINFSEFY